MRILDQAQQVLGKVFNAPVTGGTQRLSPRMAEQLGYPGVGQDEVMRALVEFTYSGEWSNLNVLVLRNLKVPSHCTSIKIMSVFMPLVGVWRNGQLEMIEDAPAGSHLEINEWAEKPRTVITENGDIYHDRGLLESEDNNQWLRWLIDSIQTEEYADIAARRADTQSAAEITFSDIIDRIEEKAKEL